MTIRLTDEIVAALKPAARDQFRFDRLVSGYGLRMTPGGVRILFAQARVGGRKVRLKVGEWPAMRVGEGRELARMAITDIKNGRDPVIERRARVQAVQAGSMVVAALAEEWLDAHGPKLKPHTVSDYRQLLRDYILPAIGSMAVTHVSRNDTDKLHAAMAAMKRRANYVVSVGHTLFAYARLRGLRPDNPFAGVKRYQEKQHERFLTESEVARVDDAITQTEMAGRIVPQAAAGLRLAMLTGARRGEVTGAKWTDVNWKHRLIRLSDGKTGARTIYLSEPAIAILKALPRTGEYIIAAPRGTGQYKQLTKAWIKVREMAGLPDVRLHDLRHSFASTGAAHGMTLQTIGRLLGHKRITTTMRYSHLASEQVAAANDQIGSIISGAIDKAATTPANVVKLPRRKRGRR